MFQDMFLVTVFLLLFLHTHVACPLNTIDTSTTCISSQSSRISYLIGRRVDRVITWNSKLTNTDYLLIFHPTAMVVKSTSL